MSNESQINSLMEQVAAGDRAGQPVYVHDKETNRFIIEPTADAKKRGTLNLKPTHAGFGSTSTRH